MKTDKKILAAFILNLTFSVFELIGGFFTGSIAILSDAVHDIGDGASIGTSYFLERKSKKQPNERYTYGYARFSVLGSIITTVILAIGSVMVIAGAIERILNPTEINYNGMIIFALIGAAINLLAAFFTHHGESINQRAINLHMLEDVLGWIVVLIGATVMRFTDIAIIDPIMSVGVAVFVLFGALGMLSEALFIFLERVPDGINVSELYEHLSSIDGVIGVHHLHVRTLDGQRNYATLHVVTDSDTKTVKRLVREELAEHGICHVTVEIETSNEECTETECRLAPIHKSHGHIF